VTPIRDADRDAVIRLFGYSVTRLPRYSVTRSTHLFLFPFTYTYALISMPYALILFYFVLSSFPVITFLLALILYMMLPVWCIWLRSTWIRSLPVDSIVLFRI
jgi:hypothetical protein